MKLPDDQVPNMERLKAFIAFLNKEYDARIPDEKVYYCSSFWSDFMHTKDFYRIRLSSGVPQVDKDMNRNPGAYDGTYAMSDQVVALPHGTDVSLWLEKVKFLQPYWWDTLRALSYRHTWEREPASKSYAATEYIGREVTIEKLN